MSTRKSRLKRKPVIEFTCEEDEEHEDVLSTAKIKAPITWSHSPAGFVIQDLQEPLFAEALELIKDNYFKSSMLCKQVHLSDDPESLEEYIRQTDCHLHDLCSICAVHEATKELAGVLVLRVLHDSDFGKVFSRIKLLNGEAYGKILRIKAYLNRKTNIFELFRCDKFLRYYLLSVKSKFHHTGIGLALIRAGAMVARSLKVPVIMEIVETERAQIQAKKIGMEVIQEVYYVDWLENGEMVFDDPGPGNYTIALMAGRVFTL